MIVRQLTTMFDNLLTSDDLCKMFRKTPLTIINWRKYYNLPVLLIPGNKKSAVRFDKDAVVKWANDRGKRIYLMDKSNGVNHSNNRITA